MYGTVPIGSLPISATPAFVAPAAATRERILFLSPREIDRATLAASSEKGTLLVTNLQDRQPQKKWRSLGATEYITVALARPVPCNALALVAHAFSSAGVVRVRGGTTAGTVTSAPVVDTAWQSAWPGGVVPDVDDWPVWLSLTRWTNLVPLQFWRIDFADPAASYIEIGRLALGKAFQPSHGVDLDLGQAIDPADLQTRTPFGFTYPDSRGKSRRFALPFSAAAEADFVGFSELQRLAGLAGDIVVAIDPAKTIDFHRYALHGLFAAGGAYQAQPLWDASGQMWALVITVTELL